MEWLEAYFGSLPALFEFIGARACLEGDGRSDGVYV